MIKNKGCKEFLEALRKKVGAKPEIKINKRFRGKKAYDAPNSDIYFAHCGFCAEVQYISDVYNINWKIKRKVLNELEKEEK